jgi:hypothetical protein
MLTSASAILTRSRAGISGTTGSAGRTPVPVYFGDPWVTTHPASQTKCAGESVTFSAAGTSSGTIGYQWQVYSGGAWSNISGATSANYTFTTASGDNGKVVQVQTFQQHYRRHRGCGLYQQCYADGEPASCDYGTSEQPDEVRGWDCCVQCDRDGRDKLPVAEDAFRRQLGDH